MFQQWQVMEQLLIWLLTLVMDFLELRNSSEGTNASGIGKFEYDVPNGITIALSTKGLNE